MAIKTSNFVKNESTVFKDIKDNRCYLGSFLDTYAIEFFNQTVQINPLVVLIM